MSRFASRFERGSRGRFGRSTGAGGFVGYVFANQEAAVFVAAMTVEPDEDRKQAIDTLVGALKAASVWDLLDFFHIYAAHAEQAALLNLVNPGTYDATNNGATFTADQGFTGNGSGAYLGTGFTPSTAGGNMTQNSAHVGVWLRTFNSDDGTWFKAADDNHETGIGSFGADTIFANINDDSGLSATMAGKEGYAVANRSAADARQAYVNGSSASNDSQASTGLPTAEMYAFYYPFFGGLYGDNQISFAHAGASLNGTQVAAVNTALTAYLAAL